VPGYSFIAESSCSPRKGISLRLASTPSHRAHSQQVAISPYLHAQTQTSRSFKTPFLFLPENWSSLRSQKCIREASLTYRGITIIPYSVPCCRANDCQLSHCHSIKVPRRRPGLCRRGSDRLIRPPIPAVAITTARRRAPSLTTTGAVGARSRHRRRPRLRTTLRSRFGKSQRRPRTIPNTPTHSQTLKATFTRRTPTAA